MPDEPLLREKARDAIRAGGLPSRRPDATLGGPGFGGACALCGELVRRNEMELAAELILVTRPLGYEALTTSIHGAIWCGSSSASAPS